MSCRSAILIALLGTLSYAQTKVPEKPQPDVIIFTDGEKLVGQLESSNGASVTFKSDMVGEITVDWAKVQEVHSNRSFAVIPKNVTFKRHADTSSVPEGVVSMADQKLTVTPDGGAPKTLAVADSARMVDDAAFRNAVMHQPGFFRNWSGTITAAAALVEATQQSETFSGAISLARIEPSEDWLTRRNRTTLDFSGSYGTISQPNTPTIKTDIFHLGVERDEYISGAFFVFGQGLLDHNFSQDLTLQQTYGGGIGWSILRRPKQNLDLKGGLTYIRQQFGFASSDESLIAASLEEDYKRNLRGGMTFVQQLTVNPALNDANALSAKANGLLTMPLYKRISASLGISDSYLHDPPPAFKKNSFEFTAGLTYSVK